MIDKILKDVGLEESVKFEISKSFNEAVELRAAEIASETLNSKEATLTEAFEEKMTQLEEKYQDKLNELDEKSEEYKSALDKEYDEKLAEAYDHILEEKETLVSQIDDYLKVAINEYKSDVLDLLEGVVVKEQNEAINEALKKAVKAAGLTYSDLTSQETVSNAEELKSMNERYSNLLKKYDELNENYQKAIKLGLMNELKEGMSLVESAKFEKIATLVPFESSESYYNKLVSLKESVCGIATEDSLEESEQPSEAVKSDKKVSSVSSDFVSRSSVFF